MNWKTCLTDARRSDRPAVHVSLIAPFTGRFHPHLSLMERAVGTGRFTSLSLVPYLRPGSTGRFFMGPFKASLLA